MEVVGFWWYTLDVWREMEVRYFTVMSSPHQGIAGTDVAKEASDIILTDDNFTSIVKVMMRRMKIIMTTLHGFQQASHTFSLFHYNLQHPSLMFHHPNATILFQTHLSFSKRNNF